MLIPRLVVANEELERTMPQLSELEREYDDNDDGREELNCGEL